MSRLSVQGGGEKRDPLGDGWTSIKRRLFPGNFHSSKGGGEGGSCSWGLGRPKKNNIQNQKSQVVQANSEGQGKNRECAYNRSACMMEKNEKIDKTKKRNKSRRQPGRSGPRH